MKTALPVVLAAALIFAVGTVAVLLGMPAIFPSLGPTAFVQVETPTARAARPWNVLVGHLCGAIAGYVAVLVTGSGGLRSVLATGEVSGPRVSAAVIAVALTIVALSVLRANHPPAAATTLLIALGGFAEVPTGPVSIAIGVLVIAILGELARRVVLPRDAPIEARGLGLPWVGRAKPRGDTGTGMTPGRQRVGRNR